MIRFSLPILIIFAVSSNCYSQSPVSHPNTTWNYNTGFSDEFNSGTLDYIKWNSNVGDWGTWSWEPENAFLKDTVLALRMQQKTHTRGGITYYFTSGILQNKKTITYGYFEAKIKASDKWPGTCPAFWLYSVGQPTPTEEEGVQYSEIDAVEIFQIVGELKTLEMNLHARVIKNGLLTWVRPGTGYADICRNTWVAPWDPREEYHTYGVLNRLDSIFWYVDGIQRGSKKNLYWHLPMYITVSMGLRNPYEKYINGVRTVMPFPDTNPEPGFPTEMYCDYVRTWDTPPQLYAEKEKYQNVEFLVDMELKFECRYFAGNGKTVLANEWNGITCKLQEIKPDGSVVNEIALSDNSAVGKESGISTFMFSLVGITPSDELPSGNKYVLKPVFKSSNNEGEDVYMKDIMYTVIIKGLDTSNSQIPDSERKDYISLYPNPASEMLHVFINDKTTKEITVGIYNSMGAKVYSQVITANIYYQIDVSSFAKGLYIFRTENSISEKLIIN